MWSPRCDRPRLTTLLEVARPPSLAVLVIGGLDLVRTATDWPIPVQGALDEPAHLLTAWLVLDAVVPPDRQIRPWALAGAVLIDLDHVPLYVRGGPVTRPGGRPVTHSLATAAVLAAAARAVPRARVPLTGLAAGVLLHLLRDLATGPGVPLLWPLRPDDVRVPPRSYALVLAAAAAIGRAARAPARKAPRGSA